MFFLFLDTSLNVNPNVVVEVTDLVDPPPAATGWRMRLRIPLDVPPPWTESFTKTIGNDISLPAPVGNPAEVQVAFAIGNTVGDWSVSKTVNT